MHEFTPSLVWFPTPLDDGEIIQIVDRPKDVFLPSLVLYASVLLVVTISAMNCFVTGTTRLIKIIVSRGRMVIMMQPSMLLTCLTLVACFAGHADASFNYTEGLCLQTTANCVAPPVIDGNINHNTKLFELLATHTSFTAAPLVTISGMISVIIGAPRQAKIIAQGRKKVGMMTSPTMLSCPALVLACFTHANVLCNKEEGALAFEKVVRSFLSCMLLLTLVCSSQKLSCPKLSLS